MEMATSHRIRTLIVDDESLAREKIRNFLLRDPQIEVIGECANGPDAIVAIQQSTPDLLMLDIQMPQMDGFSVLEAVSDGILPHVIFVTAYDQYALRAFEFHALDYLLKPFDWERFEQTLQRAKDQVFKERSSQFNQGIQTLLEQLKERPRYLDRLVIKSTGRVSLLKTDEIDWIEAEGNYARLHVGKESYLLRETISSLDSQLDPKTFLRIHRSTIVNLNRIKELQSWFHGEFQVILRDGTQLLLSRSYREKLEKALGRTL
ncbi:MAG TPA: LytTR family DNA-binding domain-containing protein [Terriglobia bacterium]|nr:LytTR family DNA-binding domain-containing protein [Terriglobia bacterium]